MNEKKYILTVSGRTPRGRRRRNTSVGSGGSVYVTVGSQASVTTYPGDNTPISSGSTGGNAYDDTTVAPPANKTAWRLIPEPTSVKIYDGMNAPYVGCSVERTVDGTLTRFYTTQQLTEAGVALWVKVDEGEWQPYVIGLKKAITTSTLSSLSTQNGRRLITQGNDIDSATAEHMITFALRDTAGLDKTYSAVNIPVVRDGQNGAPGASGPMIYPAGEWNVDIQYRANEKCCPVVMHNGQYYVLQPEQVSQNTNPAEDYAANGDNAKWQIMDHMSYVFADILMANFAKLGAAVFYGDYMFSQHGIAYGEASTDYQNIAFNEDGSPTDTFHPNYCVNLRTGQMWTVNQELREFKALIGTIGPFSIGYDKMMANGREGEYDDFSLNFSPRQFNMSQTKGIAGDYYTANVGLGSISGDIPMHSTVGGIGKKTVTAARFVASNATYNRAVEAKGAIVSDSVVVGFGVQTVDALRGSSIQLDYSTDKVLVKTSGGGVVVLPRLTNVEGYLGISHGVPFMASFMVVAHHNCGVSPVVQGRDVATTIYKSSEYPTIVYTGTGAGQTSVAIPKGGRMQITLFYDGTDYYAYY